MFLAPLRVVERLESLECSELGVRRREETDWRGSSGGSEVISDLFESFDGLN